MRSPAAPDSPAWGDPAGLEAVLSREAAAGRVAGVEPGPVSVTWLGAGESFTAWLLRAPEARRPGGAASPAVPPTGDAEGTGHGAEPVGLQGGAQGLGRSPRVVRVARRRVEDLPRSLAGQYEALARVPEGLGARGVALEEGSDNALGAPYVVTTYVPGRVVPAREWTPGLACSLAGQVARLHHLMAGGQQAPEKGSTGTGRQSSRVPHPGALVEAGYGSGGGPGPRLHPGALAEAEKVLGWWRSHHPHTLEDPRVVGLLGPWWQELARLDPAMAGTPLHPLVHHDVVVTNVVVDSEGVPRLIDWEWGGPGDPAKDLALIGGEVTGGPWYADLPDQAVTGMVARYVAVRHQLAESGERAPEEEALGERAPGETVLGETVLEEVRCLRARRDAWELLDRVGNLLYCLSRGGQGGYPRWADELASSLAARLDGLSG